MDGPAIRAARDEDGSGLIALVGACFAEYPGCVLDVESELPELRRIASAFRAGGGQFWVAETGGLLVGSAGWAPCTRGPGVELKKLYVARSWRRRGLGSRLCELVEGAARERSAHYVDLWSDTRFREAHQLYEARGYVRGPRTRELGDLSNTVEYYYRLDLQTAKRPGGRV